MNTENVTLDVGLPSGAMRTDGARESSTSFLKGIINSLTSFLKGIINRFSQWSIGMNTENMPLDVGLPSGAMRTDGARERLARRVHHIMLAQRRLLVKHALTNGARVWFAVMFATKVQVFKGNYSWQHTFMQFIVFFIVFLDFVMCYH